METKSKNPTGLHQRYYIQKLIPNPDYGVKITDTFLGEDNTPEYIYEDVAKDAEYFVMRLDTKGNDINHIKACRIGIHAYADAIEATIPKLAKDLRERYPLL